MQAGPEPVRPRPRCPLPRGPFRRPPPPRTSTPAGPDRHLRQRPTPRPAHGGTDDAGHIHAHPGSTPAAGGHRPYLLEALTQMALVLGVAEFQDVLAQEILNEERRFINPWCRVLVICMPLLTSVPLHAPPQPTSSHGGQRGPTPRGVSTRLAPGPSPTPSGVPGSGLSCYSTGSAASGCNLTSVCPGEADRDKQTSTNTKRKEMAACGQTCCPRDRNYLHGDTVALPWRENRCRHKTRCLSEACFPSTFAGQCFVRRT